jgi:DNA-binding response OmpR family regulator
MPGIGGYELCRLIKQNERLAQIPVMLLVSSFEPFDEGEARRAGADDIVTKPFQSIRQLVNRVGSLLQGRQVAAEQPPREYSPDGPTSTPESEAASSPTAGATVLVEASTMEIPDDEPKGPACPADLEFQTADTQRLERVSDDDTPASQEGDWQFVDTVEVDLPARSLSTENEKRDTAPLSESQMAELLTAPVSSPAPAAPDSLLELDDEVGVPQSASDDVFLDLDFEEQVQILKAAAAEPVYNRDLPEEDVVVAPVAAQTVASVTEVSSGLGHTPAYVETMPPVAEAAPTGNTLSEQALDAIAEKVVQRLSDKVVREIAWEVVPDLAELMIRKKLEEQK